MAIGTVDQLQDKNLVDVKNLPTRKLYLYEITNHGDKGFIKEQALSILHIKSLTTIDVVRAEEITQLQQVNISNNSKGNTAKIDPTLTGMVYSTEEHFESDKVLIGSFEDISYKIDNDGKITKAELYFIDNIRRQLLHPTKTHGKGKKYNPTDMELTNVKDVKRNYNALEFIYTFSPEINNPTNIDFEFDSNTLLSKIMAKGQIDGKKHQDIDLVIKDGGTKLSLLVMTPVSTNYKLSMFSHWLDANRTLPFIRAKQFLNANNMKSLFSNNNVDFKGWSTTQISNAYDIILHMMELTKAYATNFKEYRETEGDAKGKIKADAKIGDVSLIDLTNKDALAAVDGFIENFKSNNPAQFNSPGFKVLTTCIIMLSSYIKSSYSIGRGGNEFYKVYLPWYFIPTTAISKNLTGNFNVKLASEYFKLTGDDPLALPNKYKELGLYLVNDLNGWVSQPELPNKLTPLNKFARAINIDTKSDNDLKYLFLIPFKQNEIIEKLYGTLTTDVETGKHDENTIRHLDWNKSKHLSQHYYELGIDDPSTPTPNDLNLRLISICLPPKFADLYWSDIGFAFMPHDINVYRRNSGKFNIRNNSDLIEFISLNPNQSVKASNISNITATWSTSVSKEYANDDILFHSTLSVRIVFDYIITVDGTQQIQTITHNGVIFDKLNWRKVSLYNNNNLQFYNLQTIPTHKFNFNVEKINEINIQAIWLDNISINLKSGDRIITFHNIELPSMDDETLSNFTILL